MASQALVPSSPHALLAIDDTPGRFARVGWGIVFAFFGLFLGWAAIVRLDAAATASGSIAVAGNRQAVQHRDGGVVKAIHVRDGAHVRAGDVLIELEGTEVAATERSLAAQAVRLQAERARLLAERSGGELVAPPEFAALTGADRDEAARALYLARTELTARRAALAGRKRVLGQQSAELAQEVGGLGNRIALNGHQDGLYREELEGMRALAKDGWVSKNRVRQVERAMTEVGGQTAQLRASAASTREQIGERRLQALGLDTENGEKVATELRETEASLNDVLPKYRAARGQLEATRIRATASGQVVGLSVFTVGGVIAPGQTLMNIVPDAAPLVVEAQFSPDDADDLAVGQRAEVRVTALHDRTAPPLNGAVSRVSADVFKDERTGASYYTATIAVPTREIAALEKRDGARSALRSGLPVQVMVPLRRRTLLQYLLEPLDQAVWRGMREH